MTWYACPFLSLTEIQATLGSAGGNDWIFGILFGAFHIKMILFVVMHMTMRFQDAPEWNKLSRHQKVPERVKQVLWKAGHTSIYVETNQCWI